MSHATAVKETLVRSLDDLSDEQLEQVLDWVRELKAPPASTVQDDPLLRIAGCLSGEPLSSRQMDEELYGKGPAS